MATMGVFKKQGVYWIDYYVSGHRKRERIALYKRLAKIVLRNYTIIRKDTAEGELDKDGVKTA
jgi:hypothetical protein